MWYQWQAPASGTVTFDTAGSDFDTLLAVYVETSGGALSVVASNDDDGTVGVTSRLSFTAIAGAIYYVAVDGYDADTGNIVLSWSF